MSNEATETLRKYIYNKCEVFYCDCESELRNVFYVIQKGEYQYPDPPDILISSDKMILIIEHFEFDCYRRTKGGSRYRKELARIDRVDAAILPTKEAVINHEVIDEDNSISNYFCNMKQIFSEHYMRIDDYISVARNHWPEADPEMIKVLFLIEDKSPLGVYIETEEGVRSAVLGKSREFIEFFKTCKRVDYVIACATLMGSSKNVWFITQEHADKYLEDSKDFRKYRHIKTTPNFISAKMLIDMCDD